MGDLSPKHEAMLRALIQQRNQQQDQARANSPEVQAYQQFLASGANIPTQPPPMISGQMQPPIPPQTQPQMQPPRGVPSPLVWGGRGRMI